MAQPPEPDGSDRRGRLRALRLRVLVRDHLGHDVDAEAHAFALGAALVVDGSAWVMLDEQPARGLGSALAWAVRNGARSLDLLAERDTGTLARRAEAFTYPITVWHVDDRTLLPAVAEPLAPPMPPRPQHLELVPTIEAGGAEPVVEHGVVIGEVRGLEVCRVVDDAATGAVRLEVGVGAHDREAFAIIHGDVPTVDALAGVVSAVVGARRVDAAQHPLHHLMPERLLRWRLQQRPQDLGLVAIESTQPPSPRPNVKDRMSCTARGRRADGAEVVVVCSVGVDLDVIPYATDARLTGSARSDVLVVAAARDLVPVTVELAALLRRPMTLVPLSS